jgi:hypothetical protein
MRSGSRRAREKDLDDKTEILLYQTEDGQSRLEVSFSGETCWLSLKQMAELFQSGKLVISRHIKNVFEGGERTKTLKGWGYQRGVA